MKNDTMKTTKTLSFNLSAIAPCDFAEDASIGSCESLTNMRGYGSALQSVGKLKELMRLSDGETLIAAHRVGSGINYLTLAGVEVRHKATLADDDTLSIVDETIGSLPGKFTCATTLADVVILGNEGGDVFLHYADARYRLLDERRAIPTLRLKVENAGVLSATVNSMYFTGGYTRWQSPLTDSDLRGVTANMRDAFLRITADAAAAEVYVNPIVVRYAVRMTDGTYLYVSSPLVVGYGIPCSQRYTATVVNDGSVFTGMNGFTINAGSFTLGVEALGGFDSAWDNMVAAIEILVSDGASPLLLQHNVDYRCETTTTGTRQELLSMAFRTRQADSLVRELLDAMSWKVVGVITDFEALRNGKAKLRKVQQYAQRQAIDACVATIGKQRCSATAISHNRRIFSAVDSTILTSQWGAEEMLNVDNSTVPHEAAIVAHIATESGDAVTVWRGSGVGRPLSLNPLLSYPDTRITRFDVYTLCEGTVKEFSATLNPAGSMSIAVDSRLLSVNLAESELGEPDFPSYSTATERQVGQVSESAEMNALATRCVHSVCESRVIALGASMHRTNDAIGTPLYAFAVGGIYALPYRTTSAAYAPAVIISRKRISAAWAVDATPSRLCFTDTSGELFGIDRYKVERITPHAGRARRLAYCHTTGELWILADDGSVTIAESSGLLHRRTEKFGYLLTSDVKTLAVTDYGAVYGIDHEIGNLTDVDLLTAPFTTGVRSIATSIRFDISAENCNLVVTLYGENGHSCHGMILSRHHLAGRLGAPVTARVVAPAVERYRIGITGKMPARSIIGKISLKFLSSAK